MVRLGSIGYEQGSRSQEAAMDLIAALTSQLGIDADKAQGLAGAALGSLQQQVSQKLGGADAASLAAQIPELEQWKARAASLGGSGGGALGGAGGLLGAASSLLGGGSGGGFDIASLVQLAVKSGVGPAAAKQLLPLVLQFLQSRLDPGLLSKISAAVPALSGAGNKGGLLGALGGILGG
jgi:hypothetical protein